MNHVWLNDGEPDENGDYIAEIRSSNGSRVSTFKGKTHKEVADKLLEAQVNASREIAKMRRPDKGVKALKAEPKELTPDDNFRLAAEITDPNKVVDAVTEIVTAKIGLQPQQVGEAVDNTTQQLNDAYYRDEANAFLASTPEYYPVGQNRDKLFGLLKKNGWDLTRNNLSIAFQELTEQGEMIAWPDGEDINTPPKPAETPNGTTPASTAPNAPAPRPRSIASGIRNSDASALPPGPQPRKQKYTRADIATMSRAEYNYKLANEPGFRQQVDAMPA